MPFNIGPGELLLILAIALLVIGPGRLPDVGAALGKSLREFRKASTEMQDAVTSAPVMKAPHWRRHPRLLGQRRRPRRPSPRRFRSRRGAPAATEVLRPRRRRRPATRLRPWRR
jgi:sec-independent protein translocase protein TatA